MFFDELTPIIKELSQQPVAFFSGFFSGIFRLNLSDDPVKSWLNEQGGSPDSSFSTGENNKGKSDGPQSIAID